MSSPRQYSNPLLWSVILIGFVLVSASIFSFWYARGAEYGATKPRPEGSGGAEVPDHAALIARLDEDVLDLGRSVYQANCVSCHGSDGRAAVSGARIFPEEEFTNGADPYSQYQTLVRGLGLMPPQPMLSVEEKYAVTHFIREEFLREDNPSQYTEIDDEYLANGPWPQPGSADDAAVSHPYGANAHKRLEIPVKALSYQRVRAGLPVTVRQWQDMVRTADISSPQRARLLGAHINAYAAQALMQAVASEDLSVFAVTLSDYVPGFALLSGNELRTLQHGLREQLPEAPAPIPVPDEITDSEVIEEESADDDTSALPAEEASSE
ncbi:MAG: cytochrome c [Planctomycetota bacterium]|nr:MAG: cytochrome c [Planctomycetota bacterium]